MVLGCETFGRWSSDAALLIDEVAWLKARRSPPLLRKSAQLAYASRWWGLIGVGTQCSVTDMLLCNEGGDMLSGTDVSGRSSHCVRFLDCSELEVNSVLLARVAETIFSPLHL